MSFRVGKSLIEIHRDEGTDFEFMKQVFVREPCIRCHHLGMRGVELISDGMETGSEILYLCEHTYHGIMDWWALQHTEYEVRSKINTCKMLKLQADQILVNGGFRGP